MEHKATPQEDCARYKARYGSWSTASDNEENSQSMLVAAIESKRGELQDNAAVQRWYETSEELKAHAANERAEQSAADERDKAMIAVLRHLGYSEPRLQELWDWRAGSGSSWKENMDNKTITDDERFRLMKANMLPFTEAKDFCKGLGVEVDG